MNITEKVMKARESDAEAISALYNEYKNDIYFICLRFMDNEKDAGIVLQYTFFQAFHKIAVLKNPENFGMWLYIIAANRCRVLLRDKYPMMFAQPDEKPSKIKFMYKNNAEIISSVAAEKEARDAILQITDRLPDLQRMSVILYFYCRMSFAQIAKILDCDESLIKLRLSQADTQIKNEIDTLSVSIGRLKEFSGIEEIGVVLHDIVTPVPEDLSENIVATSATLAASAAGYPYLDGKDKSQIKFADGDHENKIKPMREKKPLTDDQRVALRNIITISVVLVLAASIIIGAIFVIKKAADGIAMATGIVTNKDSDPISSDDITTAPVTETASDTAKTESTVTEPSITESPATEPPVTKPPVTKPPVTEPPATTEVPNILFDSDVIGNEVTITKYGGSAKEVDIPANIGGKSVTKIAAYAFQDSTSLISVRIPASIKSIGVSAFSGCKSLTTVTFSSGLTSIDDYAFLNCVKLSALKIPETVTKIGVSAFGSTAWLGAQKTAFLTGGDGVLIKYLGQDSAVTVPDGIKSMTNAFYYKNSVISVVLPSGITNIGTYAFCNCPGLKSITLPDTVTAINDNAIYNCSSLAEIKVKAGSYAETWCKNKGFSAIIVNY